MKRKWIVVAIAAFAIALAGGGCKVVFESNPVAESKPVAAGSVAVESVTLNKPTLALAPDKTEKLMATIKPDNADNKTVQWSSSNTEIATVDNNGTVKAVKVGTATITVQAGGKSATCLVTVSSQSGGEDDNDFVIEGGVLIKYNGSKSTVTIPAGVTQIGSGAFEGCTSLTTVNIPTGVTSIGDSAFKGCAKLTTVNIPDSVTCIKEQAFLGCMTLESVVIPDSVTDIEICAFSNCEGLKTVTIPAGVKTIEYGAFAGCSNLTEVTISNGVETIGECAFFGCNKLTEITIPNGVKSIGDSAFRKCLKLAKVSIPASVNSVGRFTFSEVSTNLVVNYSGTKSQWDAIKGIDIILVAKGTTIKCNDTTWSVN